VIDFQLPLNNSIYIKTFILVLIMGKCKKIREDDLNDIPLGLFASIIHRARMMYLNNQLKTLNVTSSQFIYLIKLYRKGGQTQEDLANHLFVDKGTVQLRNWRIMDSYAGESIQKIAEGTFFT